jgi:hypothetical protein
VATRSLYLQGTPLYYPDLYRDLRKANPFKISCLASWINLPLYNARPVLPRKFIPHAAHDPQADVLQKG